MRKITKVICRFIASEYDEEGNLLCELPVAAGKEEFNATLFYPHGDHLDTLIDKMEEDLNDATPEEKLDCQANIEAED